MASDDRLSESSRTGSPANVDAVREFAEAILQVTPQPFVVLNSDLKVDMANPAFCRQFEVREEETVGKLLYELGNGQWDIPRLRELLGTVETEGKRVEQYRVEHEFETIGHRVMLVDADRMNPGAAEARKILLAISDVTEAEQTRWELEGRKEYAEKVVDAVRDPLLVLDWDLQVKAANQPFYETFQVDPSQTAGRMVYDLGNGQWNIPKLRELLEQVLPDNESFDDFEIEHDFEEIGRRIMLLNARRIDHLKLILLAIEDVTERRREQQQQELLAGELHHRVKNLLANVQSLLRQTRRHSADLDTFVRDFGARLESLGRTQDLLLEGNNKDVSVRDLLHLELNALGAREGEDFTLAGARVALAAEATQPLAMIIHELATNAAKYGALSAKNGRIEVTWRVEQREGTEHFCLRWREGGVRIPQEARKQGFGIEMIGSGARVGLRGHSEFTLHPDGAECLLEFPLD